MAQIREPSKDEISQKPFLIWYNDSILPIKEGNLLKIIWMSLVKLIWIWKSIDAKIDGEDQALIILCSPTAIV